MQDIFLFEKRGLGPNGKVRGRFYSTGIVPKCAEKLIAAGIPPPSGLSEHSVDI
jgi:pilus assembly protein CpaF